MKNRELELADLVTRPGTNGLCAVKQIRDGLVTFFRPYPHTADFSWTGGVLCYVGVEEWTESLDDVRDEWHLVERRQLR